MATLVECHKRQRQQPPQRELPRVAKGLKPDGARLSTAGALAFAFTVREFVADRALTSGGRLARHELGIERWAALLSRAESEIERRFGARLAYDRGVLMATGSKPSTSI